MKKTVSALLAVLVLLIAACSNGGLEEKPQAAGIEEELFTGTFTASKSGVSYSLAVNPPSRAADAKAPAVGDAFALIVTKNGAEQTSTGRIAAVVSSALDLQPSFKDAPPFKVTLSAAKIAYITGVITFDDGTTMQGPGSVMSGGGGGGGGGGSSSGSNTGKTTPTNPPDTTPAVSAVTVSPSNANVLKKGGTLQFAAAVIGANNPAQTVTWSVIGGTASGITAGGLLTVAPGETASSISVRATSTADITKYGTATVTISDIFNSVAEFSSWLDSQPYNYSTNAPYEVKLNVNSINGLGSALVNNITKYVNLDLSGSTITNIGRDDFLDSPALIGVTIPNSVTSIGLATFSDCNNLTAINVDAANAAYCSVDGALYNKNKTILIQYPSGKAEATFTIPDSVSSMEYAAIYACHSLTSVTLPTNPNFTRIATRAFNKCSRLTSITIPDSVTSIGQFAFYECSSLTSVTFKGTITSFEFSQDGLRPFPGNLVTTYLADGGGPGTYTRPNTGTGGTWTKVN